MKDSHTLLQQAKAGFNTLDVSAEAQDEALNWLEVWKAQEGT